MKAEFPSQLVISRDGSVRERHPQTTKPIGDVLGWTLPLKGRWYVSFPGGEEFEVPYDTRQQALRGMFRILKARQ